MKFKRRRSSLLPKPDWRRGHRAETRPDRRWSGLSRPESGAPAPGARWRVLALALAGLEVIALAWLALAPAFPVRHVQVEGLHRLTAAEVVRTAGLTRPVSVFSIDGEAIHRRLTALPWVRDASISMFLPDRVVMTVSEWQPVAVYHPAGSAAAVFLSDQGVVLGSGPLEPGPLLAVEGPAGPDPKLGRQAIDGRLLTAMVNIQRGLPALIGEDVATMSVDCTGNLTMTTRHGWKAYFGRVLTPEEFGTLKDKLSALKAVSGDVNLHGSDLTYINLMNPSAPAVGPSRVAGKPAPVPVPSPTPAAGVRPAGTPPPTIQVLACR